MSETDLPTSLTLSNRIRRVVANRWVLLRVKPVLPRPAIAVLMAILLFAMLFARGMYRFFDLDEHQFVVPAVLLQEGLLPYQDYPYFHMPNLIYLNAVGMAIIPYKLLAARLLSVVCGWLTILLLVDTGWRRFANRPRSVRAWLALGLPAVFACSRLFTYTSGWAWNHEAATLCALIAFRLHIRGLRCATLPAIAAAGFLVGMAIGIRLSFVFIGLPFAISLLWGRSALTRAQRGWGLGLAISTATLALLPALFPLVSQRDAFLFGNLGYAQLNTLFYAKTDSSAMTPLTKIAHGLQGFLTDPGNAVLFLASVWLWTFRAWRSSIWSGTYANEVRLLAGLLPCLAIGCWGPTPTQYQYYYMLLPFMVLGIFAILASESPAVLEGIPFRRILIFGVVLAVGTGLPRWYWSIVYLPNPERWTPVQVHRVGDWLRSQVPPNTRVLTIDPAIACEAGLPIYTEYAVGRFVMHVGGEMTGPGRQQHQMIWGEEMQQLFQDRPPNAILVHVRLLPLVPDWIQYAQSQALEERTSPDGCYRLWIRLPRQ